MEYIGLDAGSVSIKIVLIDENYRIIRTIYKRHKGHPIPVCYELLQEYAIEGRPISVTGTAGRFIADALSVKHINEITAQSYSTSRLFPQVRTIIEMGGEDSKLIMLEGEKLKDFSMNSVCAAGTGAFLDQQAERLKLTIEEFSKLAIGSKTPPRIAGRCSVFAKSDMIHLQQIATPVEDIVAGLCFAVARNFKGAIVKGRLLEKPVTFQGGVALNKGMVRAFREVFDLNDDLIVPDNAPFMGAIGAIYKALDDGQMVRLDVDCLKTYLKTIHYEAVKRQPLVVNGDGFKERHLKLDEQLQPTIRQNGKPVIGFLGIDIGSISTNLALLDNDGKLITSRYLMTAGRPIEAVMEGLRSIYDEFGGRIDILSVGTTGSGRYMISDFFGADIVKNEITAQATAAIHIDKTVDTIFEIGGQDSKYIAIEDGVIVDFEMNKACAAGTGSFLEEQAEKLNISIKGEFADIAFSSDGAINLGERCTVFMENSLMANLQKGANRGDLLAGLAYSIVENYINRVVAGKKIGKNIFFQGGTAFNKAVVAAFEKYTGQSITVPRHHEVTGAIGMALFARDKYLEKPVQSAFKGFSIFERPYTVNSFECKGCSNLCEINRVNITGERGALFYGGRCEKYDINKKHKPNIENLFQFRDELLWKPYEELKNASNGGNRGIVGIPFIFLMHDFLPFWTTLVYELGYMPKVSPRTNRQVVNKGVETVLSESCFPVKVAHGHVKYLIDSGIDMLLIPSYVNLSTNDEEFEKAAPCPYTQTIPYVANAAFDNMQLLRPIVDFTRPERSLIKEIERYFHKVSTAKITAALKKAWEVQKRFKEAFTKKAQEVISSINETSIVIVGRAYNSFDSGINLQIPEKLATLNVKSIPMDMLPLDSITIKDKWSNMYWRSGQRILQAARFIKNHPLLYPIYIGNFNCGPDSFILKYFAEEMGDKPFLHLEIDEHSADAGAITRCEAFLDSIANRRNGKSQKVLLPINQKVEAPALININNTKTVYIPPMSDHAYALAAGFQYCGVNSEVLPDTDAESIAIGKRFVSGKECYPCAVTSGDMLKKVFSDGFDKHNSVFFMPSGTGPCRFGQYNVFQKLILDKAGLNDVQIFAPVQDTTFYKDLGIAGTDFVKRTWQGIIAYELLVKCLHETRPFEKQHGAAEALYILYKQRLFDMLRKNDKDVDDTLINMRRDFENIPVNNKKSKPMIGVVGEIFVRSNRFSNENLIRKLETLGSWVWLSPVEEWTYYINYFSLKNSLIKKYMSGIIDFLFTGVYQKTIEHRYNRYFDGFLDTAHEPEIRHLLKKASPYVHESFAGETILSIGKAVDLIERGASGIVNVMPFGCMPGTIVTALMRSITKQYGVPCISLPYDGTESNVVGLHLEAFIEQAKNTFYSK
ncbi:MAG: acyl-CoA dehydratase activase [Candidatus Magnetoovum sp. WYHC-5]|nr:acyl-CoA dehydratase activase [Candidatus Magnetoovum sp. WYHC-5]